MRLVVFLCGLLLPFTIAAEAQAASQWHVFSLPFHVTLNECIGGAQCGGLNNTIDFFIHNDLVVGSMAIFADDDIGSSHKARLQLLADGVLIGDEDVKKDGGQIFFSVNRFANKLSLRCRHQSNDSGGDECRIGDVWLRQ